jgi:hypothetical protein
MNSLRKIGIGKLTQVAAYAPDSLHNNFSAFRLASAPGLGLTAISVVRVREAVHQAIDVA